MTKYENHFDVLLDRLIAQSKLKPHILASRSGILGKTLSNVRHNRARLGENTAMRIAENLGIPLEYQREFILLATNRSFAQVKIELGKSYFENQLPIRFKT